MYICRPCDYYAKRLYLCIYIHLYEILILKTKTVFKRCIFFVWKPDRQTAWIACFGFLTINTGSLVLCYSIVLRYYRRFLLVARYSLLIDCLTLFWQLAYFIYTRSHTHVHTYLFTVLNKKNFNQLPLFIVLFYCMRLFFALFLFHVWIVENAHT